MLSLFTNKKEQNHSFVLLYFSYLQLRPSCRCHRAMALVVFLPRPEVGAYFGHPVKKKSQIPEVALVDFSPDGRPC